ncbi:MAG TPA: hypothetical protein VLB68_01830 [Pyrinomonadaceae bacterium]|jgi:hypothetical protein|nr:hypothetical protein [Pyrinomonadaceae bacterium]
MKTFSRLLLIVAVLAIIYLATIGRDDLYRILDAINDVIQAFAANYQRK